jgi:lipoprotein-releasing system permease protein
MTLFAWLAIAVGVAAMCSLLAVMYGFESSLRDKVLNAYPHVLVKAPRGAPIADYAAMTEKFRALPDAKRVVPFLDSEMIVQSPRRTLGAVVWGIPAEELQNYKRGLVEGRIPSPDGREPEVLVGIELSHRLSLVPGESIKIFSPLARSGPIGALPQAGTFKVAGLYQSGHYEFDQQYLFMVLEDVQDLLRRGNTISGWHLWASDLDGSHRLAEAVRAVLPEGLEAQEWKEFNAALFQSLELEQLAMFLVLSFAVAIAVMNVVITLLMHVTHKRRNIGVLMALGASQRQIRGIFLRQGALLGGVGLALGAVLFVLFVVYVRYFSDYLLPDIYYDRTIPVELRPWSIATIFLVAIVMIALATLYPALRASKTDPIEAIRE